MEFNTIQSIEISKDFDYKGFMDAFVEAERNGDAAVKRKFDELFLKWKDSLDDCVALTLALNHLMWIHYESEGRNGLHRIYDALWSKIHNYALKHYKGRKLYLYMNFLDDRHGD